jgi:hypothetical protein
VPLPSHGSAARLPYRLDGRYLVLLFVFSEWFMGVSDYFLHGLHGFTMFLQVAALKGYEHANMIALDLWGKIYPDQPFYTITDTFTTEHIALPDHHLVLHILQ